MHAERTLDHAFALLLLHFFERIYFDKAVDMEVGLMEGGGVKGRREDCNVKENVMQCPYIM